MAPTHRPHLTGRRLLLALLACAALPVRAQVGPDRVRETLVKAAFLHKFSSFVDWPEGSFPRPDTPLRIGVLGNELLLADLRDLARERPRDGRPVEVVRVTPGDAMAGLHVLYFRATTPARAADVLSQVPEGVLTVADLDGEHPRGCVLSFFLEEGRVRFGASQEAAARQKLRLSSRLLAVARSVRHDDGAPVYAGHLPPLV